ncbi:MAG TPA: hypothetical protein VLG49_07235 [Rhabdochlamydiaceae bacterium]|nr:hypothetical protein [Rhabdochlamydiaceae bacterium]
MSQQINFDNNGILNQQSNLYIEIQASNLVKKAQHLADSVFEKQSDEINQEMSLLSNEIEALILQDPVSTGSQGMLQLAKRYLENVKEQLQIKNIHCGIMNSFQTGEKPLLVTATKNQFTGAENGLGNSACPIIAMMALKQMLTSEIQNAGHIDQLINNGIEEYGNAITRIEENGPAIEYGEHIDWNFQTIAMPEFKQDGDYIGINLSENAKQDYLVALQQFAGRLQIGQKSGATLTLPPETYSLTIEKTGNDKYEVLFFDSHGHYDTTGSTNAYMLRFLSLDDASRFLETRHGFIQNAGLMNFGILLPLKLESETDQEVPRALQHDYRQAVDILETVYRQFSQENREDGLVEIMTLHALHESDANIPNFEQRLHFHLYFLHKQLKKSQDVEDYGRKALWHEGIFKAEDSEIAEVAKRAATEIILDTLLEAVHCNNSEKLGEYHDLLGAINESCRNDLNGLIYNLCKKRPEINTNHVDFGRVGFRNEEGFKAPNEIKIEAILSLIEKNKKKWSI